MNGSAGNVTMGLSADDGALVGLGTAASGINGIYQLYIQDNGSGPNWVFAGVSSLSPTFPANTIAVAVIVYDEVGRISQLIDQRPSYISSVPTYATNASENIASPTLRSGFVANFYVPRTYALSPTIPQDAANLPCSGFLLGAGSVVINSSVINIPATYISNSTTPVQLTAGQVNQIYVTAAGVLTSQVAATPGTFPANVLAIAEVTTDSCCLIRNVFDWRPSYH